VEIIDIDNPYEDYWREKERKKEEEESYPHVSPPEVCFFIEVNSDFLSQNISMSV